MWYHDCMKEFFHSWRRKAGCATLAVAVAVTGMWIRSRAIVDELQLNYYLTSNLLLSEQGQLYWIRRYPHPSFYHCRVASERITDDRGDIVAIPPTGEIWRCGWAGFIFGASADGNFAGLRIEMTYWVVPYWSLAVPWTLLAAYLLLWRSRRSS